MLRALYAGQTAKLGETWSKVQSEKRKVGEHLRDLGVDGKKILNWS
jgi:hypothetical protein